MKHNKDIEKILKNPPQQKTSEELKDRLMHQIPAQTGANRDRFRVTAGPYRASRFWRYAAAAVFILGFSAGISVFGLFNGGSAAWADVTSQVEQIDYVHFYRLEFRNGRLESARDGWFANGKTATMLPDAAVVIDDGTNNKLYNDLDQEVQIEPSLLGNIQQKVPKGGFFQMLTQGVFAYDSSEIDRQKPVQIGKDFAVYRFGPPNRKSQWVEQVTITVGRKSLLPVQMKIKLTESENAYEVYAFDYEDEQMPVRIARLLGLAGTAAVDLSGEYLGEYETQWGEKGEYAARVSKLDSGAYRIELLESFDSWAATLSVLEMEIGAGGKATFTGSGDMWSGTGNATIADGVIEGEFLGDEAGTFTMLQRQESASLAGKWQGEYESEWGERAYFVATATKADEGDYKIKIKESFDEWADVLVVLDAKETETGQFDFTGSGQLWSGKGKGTIADEVFEGNFTGEESGTFTMKKLTNNYQNSTS